MQMPPRKALTLPHNITISYLEWSTNNESNSGPNSRSNNERTETAVPLLLLHGMADHALVWLSLGNALQQNYHVVAPDLRGHGDSSKPETGYGFADTIQDLTALMNHLNWPSAHILAHSWSAKMAAVWARQAPAKFRSLMLVDPALIGTFPNWTKILFPVYYKLLPFLKMMGPFENKAAAIAQAKQLKQFKNWSALQQIVFEHAVEEKEHGQWGSKFAIAARDPMFTDVMQIPGFTQPIDIPALLVYMTKGINTSERQIKPYKQYLTNLELCQLESNHWAFLVDPEVFENAIAHFLEKCPPTA
ncbi:MAG: alpha/beta fold hydrolase [Phormidesmis sp.]